MQAVNLVLNWKRFSPRKSPHTECSPWLPAALRNPEDTVESLGYHTLWHINTTRRIGSIFLTLHLKGSLVCKLGSGRISPEHPSVLKQLALILSLQWPECVIHRRWSHVQLVFTYFGGQLPLSHKMCEGRIFSHVFVSKLVCYRHPGSFTPPKKVPGPTVNKSMFVLLVSPIMTIIIKNKDNKKSIAYDYLHCIFVYKDFFHMPAIFMPVIILFMF